VAHRIIKEGARQFVEVGNKQTGPMVRVLSFHAETWWEGEE
jgi:hypothetical protein